LRKAITRVAISKSPKGGMASQKGEKKGARSDKKGGKRGIFLKT